MPTPRNLLHLFKKSLKVAIVIELHNNLAQMIREKDMPKASMHRFFIPSFTRMVTHQKKALGFITK